MILASKAFYFWGKGARGLGAAEGGFGGCHEGQGRREERKRGRKGGVGGGTKPATGGKNWIFRAFPGLVGPRGPRKWIPRVEIYLWVGFQLPGGAAVARPRIKRAPTILAPLAPKVASAVTPLSGVKKRSRQTPRLGGLCAFSCVPDALRFPIQVGQKVIPKKFKKWSHAFAHCIYI